MAIITIKHRSKPSSIPTGCLASARALSGEENDCKQILVFLAYNYSMWPNEILQRSFFFFFFLQSLEPKNLINCKHSALVCTRHAEESKEKEYIYCFFTCSLMEKNCVDNILSANYFLQLFQSCLDYNDGSVDKVVTSSSS